MPSEIRLLRVFEQDAWFQLGPLLLAYPGEFVFLFAAHQYFLIGSDQPTAFVCGTDPTGTVMFRLKNIISLPTYRLCAV